LSNGSKYLAFTHEDCNYVVCSDPAPLFSENGLEWSKGTSAEDTFDRAEILNAVDFEGGVLAIGVVNPADSSEDAMAAVWRSNDGVEWSLVDGWQEDVGPLVGVCEGTGFFGTYQNIAAVGSRLVQIGTVLEGLGAHPCRPLRDPPAHAYLRSSSDGVTWQEQAVPQSLANADDEYWNDSVQTLIGGSQFLIAANDRPAVMRSSDGVSWESAELEGGTEESRVTQIVKFDAGYVALGWLEDISRRETRLVWYSADGANWRLVGSGGDVPPIRSLTSFGRGVLALGVYRFDPAEDLVSGVTVSFDGSSWTYPQTPFEGHSIDELVSNGRSVLAIARNEEDLGDQFMWRGDLRSLAP
jgi:hypothetical protein